MCGLNFIILSSKLIHLRYFNICKSKPHILSLHTRGNYTTGDFFSWWALCKTMNAQISSFSTHQTHSACHLSFQWSSSTRPYLYDSLDRHMTRLSKAQTLTSLIIWSTLTVKLKMNHSTNYHLQSHNIQEISWSRWSQTSGGSHTRFSSHLAKAV